MDKLTRNDLYSLEKYAEVRDAFRDRVMTHKRNRKVHVGPHATLYFEDRLIMQYQIQEMLRIERIFKPDAIQEELDTYNPLIPDGSNWKATFMIEITDEEERRQVLSAMLGIEDTVWVQVEGFDKVFAIADEDLERETADKTSSVHFLRFELTPDMVQAVKAGGNIGAGIDYRDYQHQVYPLSAKTRDSLASDLD